MTALLTFEAVSFAYAPHGPAVLRGLSLDIARGTTTVILGPNGAGKTTLLHLALGWLRAQAGHVLLDGRPLESYPRRGVGQAMSLIPQTERIPFNYSILDFVALGRAPHLAPLALPGGKDQLICEEAIEEVGLGPLRDRAVTTLSSGERQLALVARALAQQPRLLLMDEPTAHLDLAHKARLVQLVRRLVGRGMTVLATTHEPDVAAATATHLVLMREGQVYRTGVLAEVFTSLHLSATYGIPVQIAQVDGRQVVLWT